MSELFVDCEMNMFNEAEELRARLDALMDADAIGRSAESEKIEILEAKLESVRTDLHWVSSLLDPRDSFHVKLPRRQRREARRRARDKIKEIISTIPFRGGSL